MPKTELFNYIVFGSMMASVPVTFITAIVLGQRYGFI